jgi:predicted RNA-binding Zn-ribbon protein involved in translation (DUF1610 family)
VACDYALQRLEGDLPKAGMSRTSFEILYAISEPASVLIVFPYSVPKSNIDIPLGDWCGRPPMVASFSSSRLIPLHDMGTVLGALIVFFKSRTFRQKSCVAPIALIHSGQTSFSVFYCPGCGLASPSESNYVRDEQD